MVSPMVVAALLSLAGPAPEVQAPASTSGSAPPAAAPGEKRVSALGLSLLGGGSAAIVGAAVGAALWEAWAVDATGAAEKTKQELVPVVAFTTASVGVVGATLGLVGGAIIIDDLAELNADTPQTAQ